MEQMRVKKFVTLMGEVLLFSANKQPKKVLHALNSLCKKKKWDMQIKDTSAAELTRFAQAVYADEHFMDQNIIYRVILRLVGFIVGAMIEVSFTVLINRATRAWKKKSLKKT